MNLTNPGGVPIIGSIGDGDNITVYPHAPSIDEGPFSLYANTDGKIVVKLAKDPTKEVWFNVLATQTFVANIVEVVSSTADLVKIR